MNYHDMSIAEILVDVLTRYAGISEELALKLLIRFLKDNEKEFRKKKKYFLDYLNS